MPELPEVETIRRELEQALRGKKIIRVWWKKNSRIFRDFPQKNRFLKQLEKQSLKAIRRRGKYLLFELTDNLTLVLHLGMTGNLLVQPREKVRDQHTHLELYFSDFKLSFRDPRTFGRVAMLKPGLSCRLNGLLNLGPEPLSREFNFRWLSKKLAGRKSPIKVLLLDQTVSPGVGNIYSDEACFLARISPVRRAESLKAPELKKLVQAIKLVLKKAIKSQGTTFSDYRTSFGGIGDYRPLVYGREGEPCPRCGGKILRKIINNRSSFYCPKCQK